MQDFFSIIPQIISSLENQDIERYLYNKSYNFI